MRFCVKCVLLAKKERARFPDDAEFAEAFSTRPMYLMNSKNKIYALDFIHEAHGDGSFSNVHASKQNWIGGFFGVNGFNICCVANYDSARVEIYMGNANKDYNKAAYDRLIIHRSQIESALGVSLIWDRGDDIKSCKVSYRIDNVSIENEADWLRMAKFHAEWSKKFYDVIVPYLL